MSHPIDVIHTHLQFPRNENEHEDAENLEPRQEKEIVVQVAGALAMWFVCHRTGSVATVDVAMVPVEEPHAMKDIDESTPDDGAQTLREPEQTHDDPLHGARCLNIGQLQTWNPEERFS